MELRDYGNDDFWLAEALECDLELMRDLGGPTSKELISKHHARRVKSVIDRALWYFVIVPDRDSGPVGTIGIWESEWEGSRINEMGWMVLSTFQGRGLATAAGRMILDRARDEQKFREIHAFPSVSNAASNSICQKLGFLLLSQVELAYNGPPQPSNHWILELGF